MISLQPSSLKYLKVIQINLIILFVCANEFYINCSNAKNNSNDKSIIIPLNIKDIKIISYRVSGAEYLPDFIKVCPV